MKIKQPCGCVEPCGCGSKTIKMKAKGLNTGPVSGFTIEKPEYKGNAVLNAQR